MNRFKELMRKKWVVASIIGILIVVLFVTILLVFWVNKNKRNHSVADQTGKVIDQTMAININQESQNDQENNTESDETDTESDQETEEETTEQNNKTVDQDTIISDKQSGNGSEESVEESEEDDEDYVAHLSIADRTNQLIIVSASGSTADISMHETDGAGNWNEIMSTSGYVGKQGVGEGSEYASRTPVGYYTLSTAFGVNANPGSAVGYTQVDESDYWVDDPESQYYNQFVSTDSVDADWSSAEHLIEEKTAYAYAIAIDYNRYPNCVPGAGSAIFLHCSNGRATAGCVSIPQNKMIFVLQNLRPGCLIVIDAADNIMNY